jgi:hypothetical protein
MFVKKLPRLTTGQIRAMWAENPSHQKPKTMQKYICILNAVLFLFQQVKDQNLPAAI